MMAGIDDAMILPQQLFTGVFGDGAELVVDVGDFSLRIGDGDDGMFVKRGFQVADFLE